jgi:hypothetical protein
MSHRAGMVADAVENCILAIARGKDSAWNPRILPRQTAGNVIRPTGCRNDDRDREQSRSGENTTPDLTELLLSVGRCTQPVQTSDCSSPTIQIHNLRYTTEHIDTSRLRNY